MFNQVLYLFLLAMPVACITWTVTHEEVFRGFIDYCHRRSKNAGTIMGRKFFYLFTCQYCFSHYVTIAILLLTGYKLVMADWRGYIISGFSLVWLANIYMSVYTLIHRKHISKEKLVDMAMREHEEYPTTPGYL